MLNAQLVEQTTRHAVYLERLKSGEVNQFAAFLRDIDGSVRERLQKVDITAFTRSRLEVFLASTEKTLGQIFNSYYDELAGNLTDIAEYEAGFEARSIDSVLVNAEMAVASPAQLRAAVFSAPLSVRGADGGKLLEPFIKDWSGVETKRVSGLIRQGYAEGRTTQQIIQSIRGTKANNYRDGALAITQRNADAIVRTGVQHVANNARAATWSQNSDIVTAYQWVSTLDSRTSAQCRALDGTQFKTGKGPLPPIHIRCRSTTVAVLSGKYKQLMDDATRASVNGQVAANETYYSWLKKQPVSFIDDTIGPSRRKLLLDGGIDAERFSAMNLDRDFKPLSLKEMRAKEPLAFERSGLN